MMDLDLSQFVQIDADELRTAHGAMVLTQSPRMSQSVRSGKCTGSYNEHIKTNMTVGYDGRAATVSACTESALKVLESLSQPTAPGVI